MTEIYSIKDIFEKKYFNKKTTLIFRSFLFLIPILVIFSCKQEPYLYEPPQNLPSLNPSDTCDENLVYYNEVKIVFDGCAISGCHDAIPTEKFSLLSYDDVVENLLDENDLSNWTESELFDVLVTNANDGDKRMPPPPMAALDISTIELLKTWVQQGATKETCGNCDTIAVGYTNKIENLISTACKSCHSGRSTSLSIDFSSYSLAKTNAVNMLERMERNEGGNGFMPDRGFKNDCNIKLMRSWINSNYPN